LAGIALAMAILKMDQIRIRKKAPQWPGVFTGQVVSICEVEDLLWHATLPFN